jgi:hypothetical protein
VEEEIQQLCSYLTMSSMSDSYLYRSHLHLSTNESGEPAALDESSLCTIPPRNSSLAGIALENVSVNEIADDALNNASASVIDHIEMEEV